jgi:hypothetical protein
MSLPPARVWQVGISFRDVSRRRVRPGGQETISGPKIKKIKLSERSLSNRQLKSRLVRLFAGIRKLRMEILGKTGD